MMSGCTPLVLWWSTYLIMMGVHSWWVYSHFMNQEGKQEREDAAGSQSALRSHSFPCKGLPHDPCLHLQDLSYRLTMLFWALGFWYLDSRPKLQHFEKHEILPFDTLQSVLFLPYSWSFHCFSRFSILCILLWTLLSSGCMSNTLSCNIPQRMLQTLLKVVYSNLRAIYHCFEGMHLVCLFCYW